LRGQLLVARRRRRQVLKQSKTPTVKTAGVFTIADFDNNTNLKHVHDQYMAVPAYLRLDQRSRQADFILGTPKAQVSVRQGAGRDA
jgi:hypothetical protein